MGSYEGVGARIRERLLTLGYKRDDGEPDTQRFGWDNRFDKGHLYSWLRDEMTPFKDLIRLCTALDCSAEWLLTGEERKKVMPRRQRGVARKLSLVLLAAATALLSPSGSAHGQTLPMGDRDACAASLRPPSYRKWRSLLSLGLAPA